MPSLALSTPIVSSEETKKKSKSKKLKSADPEEAPELVPMDDDSEKKTKAKKKDKEKKKDKKKRKSSDEEEKSDTTSDSDLAKTLPPATKKPKLMNVGVGTDEEVEVVSNTDEDLAAADPNALQNFRISQVLRDLLHSKGIKTLFPIQAKTFDLILDGSDMVGRARTGQGKTLAFVLPILESITNGVHKASRKTGYGRPPSVLVLLPTRELANQVFTDFEFYGGAVGLSSCCLYGGSPYRAQELSLKRGVDIVVGTPGRIKDHYDAKLVFTCMLSRGYNCDEVVLKILIDGLLQKGHVDTCSNMLKVMEENHCFLSPETHAKLAKEFSGKGDVSAT